MHVCVVRRGVPQQPEGAVHGVLAAPEDGDVSAAEGSSASEDKTKVRVGAHAQHVLLRPQLAPRLAMHFFYNVRR